MPAAIPPVSFQSLRLFRGKYQRTTAVAASSPATKSRAMRYFILQSASRCQKWEIWDGKSDFPMVVWTGINMRDMNKADAAFFQQVNNGRWPTLRGFRRVGFRKLSECFQGLIPLRKMRIEISSFQSCGPHPLPKPKPQRVGHPPPTTHHEPIPLADLFQNLPEQIAAASRGQPSLAAIAAAGEEVQMLVSVVALKALGHDFNVDSDRTQVVGEANIKISWSSDSGSPTLCTNRKGWATRHPPAGERRWSAPPSAIPDCNAFC